MPRDNVKSFRINTEAEAKLNRLLRCGQISNVSEFINTLICAYDENQPTQSLEIPKDNLITTIRTIPEESLSKYNVDNSIFLTANSVMLSKLSLKRYAEAKKVIEDNGMNYYYFSLRKGLSMALVACNQEEASIMFQQYYTFDKDTDSYVRTSLPLPQYRYDIMNKTLIIVEYESVR